MFRSELFSTFDLARYKLLAIKRQEGIEEFCKGEPSISVKHHLIDGKIEAYEMPLNHHSLVQGELIYIMRSWSNQLLAMSETDIIVNANTQAVNSTGNPHPTLVAEIGSTESLNHMHDRVARYFSQRTTIQIYIAIKLFPKCRGETFVLLALLYLRSNQNPTIPSIASSFGTANLHPSTRTYLQNTVQATITDIPTVSLFDDVPGNPSGVPVNFHIDLWTLQNRFSAGL
ncbi:3140_t:CDS:2 [Diversispora eburnea]|uniref:3140_t:CDS:1 n=1 Tax=Diversispora eburnea TaxID=1213867 RepID=A0A9N9A664_9GLOM|nr:3140_t:CDS:2 [Diversispora eburnea]